MTVVFGNREHVRPALFESHSQPRCRAGFVASQRTGVGRRRGDDGNQEWALQQRRVRGKSKKRDAWRVDREIGVQQRLLSPVVLVVLPLGQERAVQAAATAKLFLLSLRSSEKPAAWIASGG